MDPAIAIVTGSPASVEVAAITVAITALIDAERSRASSATVEVSPWVVAARLAATASDPSALRGQVQAWRVAARTGSSISNLQPGRGDAR